MPRQTKPKSPMVLAPRAQDPVSDGKPRTAAAIPHTHDHYQPLPPGLTIKYTHEANRLCRVIHPGHPTVCGEHQLVIQAILLGRPGGPIRPTSSNVRRLGLRPGYDTVAIWWSSPQPHHKKRTAQYCTSKQTILVKNS